MLLFKTILLLSIILFSAIYAEELIKVNRGEKRTTSLTIYGILSGLITFFYFITHIV